LRSAKGAEETLGKITPALELLARKYDLDPANMDYDALAKKINDDDGYYEDKALSMGVSVETAKQIDQQERDTARAQREEARNLEDQKLRKHFENLQQQEKAMKKVFPKFDLKTELQNPVFARMTSPNVNISVEDAYYAVHRNEIQAAAMQATAQRTAQNISKSIQAGSRRPDEAGASGQAPSVTTFDYSKASREQREAFKKDLRARMARGEKVYPGQR
jgi:plasmid stabilization system protein ParE